MRRNSGRSDRKSAALAYRRPDNMAATVVTATAATTTITATTTATTVNDLIDKAAQNEQILRRYQQFELKLLDQNGLEPLLDMLLRDSLDYFQLDCVELCLYDPQQTLQELLSQEYLALPSLHLLEDATVINQLYAAQPAVRLISTRDALQLPLFDQRLFGQHLFDQRQLRSAALLPLVRQGVLVGSLHFGALGHQRFAEDKSTDFIAHLASIASVCLENAVNQERLHRLSMYDVLTKIKNRRAFHLALDKEVSRASRNGDPLSLLFVDLDFFKQVNDSYGHPMGDKVLREVAHSINELLRKTDHVCRYGGEEFAVILPNCGQQRAMEVAERIRQQIDQLSIENNLALDSGGSHISITLSIGACCWLPMGALSEDGEAKIANELIACSDQGVYLSKAAGRNCTHYVALKDQLASASV